MLLQPLRWFLWFLGRVIFSFRYRGKVLGWETIRDQPGPFLILPNHPAYADPPNVLLRLWPYFRMRPLLLETNFQNPVLGPFGWLLRAIRMPDLDRASADARNRAQLAVETVANALKAGQNVILWPSGRLSRDGMEHLGGARSASDILAAVPEVTVVLVRTRGLWGSMTGHAQTNSLPPLIPLIFRSLGIALANLLVFMPRRRLTFTLEAFPRSKRPEPTREAINPWLEQWYNADAPEGETPTWVPYHFLFGKRSYEYPKPMIEGPAGIDDAKPETKQVIAEIVAAKLKRPLTEEENRPEMAYDQLGIDSLDGMEMALAVEQRFGFASETVPKSIGQLWALAEGKLDAGTAKPVPPEWFKDSNDDTPMMPLGNTVAEAFANRCFANPREVAAADDMAGVLTYERMFLGAQVMGRRFAEFGESNLGLLMPASVAGDIALVGMHFAGKLPVILNWTTGPGNLAHAVELMGLRRVVTSRAFIDRTQIEVPGAEYVFLEDIKKGVGKLELLSKLLMFRYFPSVSRNAALRNAVRDENAHAVVLFTSGSEKAPKAVPLTHANVVGNMRCASPALEIHRRDSLIGFLPLFHSFGHTVTTFFPLFGGVKVVHHPDPTDAGGLVRKIAAYKPTLIAGTPTFIGYILDRAKPGDLDSLRLIMLGAEKCPDAVVEKARTLAPRATFLEGYGITECSPIVAVCPTARPKLGTLGPPLPGMEVAVLDLETDQPVPPGTMGMLHVSGPCVFPGYLGFDGPQPFKEFHGKRWYVTGDLGSLDEDGYIVFQGRLKRFLKAGGEMISLPALEEPLAKSYPPTEEGPRVAVEGIETPGGRRIVLFTTQDVTTASANSILLGAGLRGVMRIDETRRLDKIPLLGTGKTDYKTLRSMIQSPEGPK
jgi:long-chain-fatty-acid--[acyl-carrier-protein] ligase